MTTAVLNSANPIQATPFCDKIYKTIRVIGESVGRVLYGIVLAIIAIACRIFSRAWALTFRAMAEYQWYRAETLRKAYWAFEETELIEFSCNGCWPAPPADTELAALRQRYGSDTIDRWLQIGTEEVPLKSENLKRVGIGICSGMSLDFIEQYLLQIQAGKSPMEAVRAICSRYVEGASDKAQLAQIFQAAVDDTMLRTKEWNRLAQCRKEQRQKVSFSPEEASLRKHLNQAFPGTLLTDIRAHLARDQILGQQFGLNLGSAEIYVYHSLPQNYPASFSQFLEALPNGCYRTVIAFTGGAHAKSLIKTDTHYFLFDSNYGTLVFEKSAFPQKFWDLGKSYFTPGSCTLSLSPCSLK